MRPLVMSDPIAEDVWDYKLADGTARQSRVTVGRPRPTAGDLRGDWSCPIYFEGVTEGVLWVNGVGPVDALMNAMRFVADRFYEFSEVTPHRAPSTAE